MKILKKKLNVFVILVTGTFLAALLAAGYVQEVNATTSNFWIKSNDISVVNPQTYRENNANQTSDKNNANDSFLIAQTAVNLTGKWRCDDGGTYYLRQIGNELFWYGEEKTTNPLFSNAYRGVPGTGGFVVNGQISGGWVDLPKGRTSGGGTLTIRITGPNSLIKVSETGGFGGDVWNRI